MASMSEPHDSIFRIKQPTELVPPASDDPDILRQRASDGFLEETSHCPTSSSELPIEERRKPVGHIQAERLIAPDESHDASSGDSGFLLQGFVRDFALGDCSPKQVGNRRD